MVSHGDDGMAFLAGLLRCKDRTIICEIANQTSDRFAKGVPSKDAAGRGSALYL